jgi:hypothetical protein
MGLDACDWNLCLLCLCPIRDVESATRRKVKVRCTPSHIDQFVSRLLSIISPPIPALFTVPATAGRCRCRMRGS